MIKSEIGHIFSPSDLSNHLSCNYLTFLNQQVADGRMDKPEWLDPSLAILQERGLQFENSFLNNLQEDGFSVSIPEDNMDLTGVNRTLSEMKKGVDFIYQAQLEMDDWRGTADFLKRVDQPSNLGNWSYEVIDTKLARETKAGSILQLCLYTQCVERIQGVLPEYIHVVSPHEEQFKTNSYRTQEYLAYHRLMQQWLKDQLSTKRDLYPEPVVHCEICRWWQVCDKRRRSDDHLSLVAGISRLQRSELTSWGIHTMQQLAKLPLPIQQKPSQGKIETYIKVREQARMQVNSRDQGKLLYELIDQQPPVFDEGLKAVVATGLYKLPEPSPGDIYLDFEGDPFVGSLGLEYLTGWIEVNGDIPEYHSILAFNAQEEKLAFEQFMDFVFLRLEAYPELHIYHYGHYEPSALKRLMSRYATRERELDWLLRGKRFVDLLGIVRQTIRAGVERYSLKQLEVLFEFSRQTDLRTASLAKRNIEHLLELGQVLLPEDEDLNTTVAYNREDCISAYRLRNWLEKIREELINKGSDIFRPDLSHGEESDNQEEKNNELENLYNQLTFGIPAEVEDRTDAQQARWILANLLQYHWRERKTGWWEYYDLLKRPAEELFDSRTALAGLVFSQRLDTHDKYVVNEYTFPPQECDIKSGEKLFDQQEREVGEVENVDANAGIITLKQSTLQKDDYHDVVIKKPMNYDRYNSRQGAIRRLTEWVLENDIELPGPYYALRKYLIRRQPNLNLNLLSQELSALELAVEWSSDLHEDLLAIQGPPGSGKSHTGAHIILRLLSEGKTIGITANSHSVIENLLVKVIEEANKSGSSVRCGHKVTNKEDVHHGGIIGLTTAEQVLRNLQRKLVDVIGATPIFWSNQKLFEAVDVLIVDEAGQLSLADTLAAGQAAKSIILLGDPQQLKQPQQGSHPKGTEVSALEYILGDHQTIPIEKGLFIDQTRRMHPAVCEFISEMFYEGKLHSFPGLENQKLDGSEVFRNAGLWFSPTEHSDNQNVSAEEVKRVLEIIDHLTIENVTWTDIYGKRHPLQLKDILIIAPYNAQVAELKKALPPQAQVGTVDKFQGKEAPVVIYSMASSSPEDAPRGMDFLYNANRLNVAISRAKIGAIIVANPNLFSPDCRTPAQIKMANAFCRFLEMAVIIQ